MQNAQYIKNPLHYTCAPTNIVASFANPTHLTHFFKVHRTLVY